MSTKGAIRNLLGAVDPQGLRTAPKKRPIQNTHSPYSVSTVFMWPRHPHLVVNTRQQGQNGPKESKTDEHVTHSLPHDQRTRPRRPDSHILPDGLRAEHFALFRLKCFRSTRHDRAVAPAAHTAYPVIHDQCPGQRHIDTELGRNFYNMIAFRDHRL